MHIFTNNIYRATEWITRFAFLNLLWILFIFLGLIFLGFFPSTLAMFAIVRDWLNGKTDIAILNSFWKYYRQEFIKSNLLGLFIIFVNLLIMLDLYYIKMNKFHWTSIPLYVFIIFFVLFLFYLFPAFTHYDMNLLHLIKNTFFIMLVSPLHTFAIIICLALLFIIIKTTPSIAFIFGGSLYAFITTWLALHAFNKLAKKSIE